jgi:TolA-binding protein
MEAPAAAYLGGVGLMDQNRPLAAVPYFQLVIDRYAQHDSTGAIDFATPQHQELVEASLCLLELSYHRAGALGQLSGVPHLMLTRMPASESAWRAYAFLIDADALAAQGRYDDAQTMLEQLIREFPDHEVGIHANRLLAWTYARQGKDELALETEERMLARYAAQDDITPLASAYLNKAHVLFNRKNYREAVAAYEDFLNRFPGHEGHLLALFQSGICHVRLDQAGDAADRWEAIVALDPTAPIAEKAWLRMADLYFQAEHYEDAKRCYEGLLANFGESKATATAQLRLAQCEYNSGRDAEALEKFSAVAQRFPGSPEATEAEHGIEMALYRLGQDENGSEVLARLVEQYPTSSFAADAQFKVAMHHYQAEEWEAAAEEFRRVVSQFPGYSAADRAYFLMGDSYTQAGLSSDARMAYEQFLMFFGTSDLLPTVQFRLGMNRFESGDYMQAAVDFTGVLETDPSGEMQGAALYNLALCHRMLGQNTQAQAALERYRSSFPGDERASEIAYQLSDIHEQAGRTGSSIEELERSLAAGPTAARQAEIHYRMGLAHETQKDMEAALVAYGKAMAGKDKADPFRLSAVARAAAIYEQEGNEKEALAAYRDLMKNASDPELVAAAEERATQLADSTP